MTWWQQLVTFCLGLTAVLAAAGLVGRWGRRMWSTNRKFNRLLDQLLGDEHARPPIPSLMDKLTAVQDEQARLADELAGHVRWHGEPARRPSTYRSDNAMAEVTAARHRRAS